jgi:TatD DNase family protein
MYFDTHAHYDDEAFDADRDALLASLPAAGIGLVVNPGCDLASSRKAVALAGRFPHVYAAVGCHPHEAKDMQKSDLDAFAALAAEKKVVAVGEIGLDYFYDRSPREVQRARLLEQMALADDLHLPVIVHDREAHADCLGIVRQFPRVTGVFHCYSGSLEYAKTLVSLGWYLGFTGAVTFKNARKALETLAWLRRTALPGTDARIWRPSRTGRAATRGSCRSPRAKVAEGAARRSSRRARRP